MPKTATVASQEMILRTRWHFDSDAIAEAFHQFSEYPLRNNAIAVTSRPGSSDPLYDGATAGDEGEMDFTVVNEPFRNTVFEDVLNQLPVPFGRTRLMCVPPQRCYPVHADETVRYHLAVWSHPYAFIAYPFIEKIYHIPEDGYLYRMDPRAPHTAINCGPVRRFHLVIVTDQRCSAEEAAG